MRQSYESNQQTHQHDHHCNNNTKTRKIRKEKPLSSHFTEDLLSLKLAKEHKALIQKQKNREAAQRSRNHHRQYVTQLENQVRQLRQQLNKARSVCCRCHAKLANTEQNYFDVKQSQNNTNYNSILCDVNPQFEDQSLQIEQIQNNLEQSLLVRMIQPEEDHSFLKIFLFVCMVVVGVMVLNVGGGEAVERGRILMEGSRVQLKSQLFYQGALPLQSLGQRNSDKFEGLKRQDGRKLDLRSQLCLESLANYRQLSNNLRIDQENQTKQSGFIICKAKTFSSNKISSKESNGNTTNIFIKGAELQQLLSFGSNLNDFANKTVQQQAIYRLEVQIKKIDLIAQHKCLI